MWYLHGFCQSGSLPLLTDMLSPESLSARSEEEVGAKNEKSRTNDQMTPNLPDSIQIHAPVLQDIDGFWAVHTRHHYFTQNYFTRWLMFKFLTYRKVKATRICILHPSSCDLLSHQQSTLDIILSRETQVFRRTRAHVHSMEHHNIKHRYNNHSDIESTALSLQTTNLQNPAKVGRRFQGIQSGWGEHCF